MLDNYLKNNKYYREIKKRYFRQTIAHPDGEITHDGDCDVYPNEICTCGLLHTFRRFPGEVQNIFPRYKAQLDRHEEMLYSVAENHRKGKR